MFEKRLAAVPPQAFTANGGVDGTITVFNATLFKVKQQVLLNGTALPTAELEIKAIPGISTIIVGARQTSIDTYIDVSAYTVAASSTIAAVKQKRPSIPVEEINRAVYEEEPAVALRTIGVDRLGKTLNGSQDGIVPMEWDDVVLTRDTEKDLTLAQFYLAGQHLWDVEILYDGDKDSTRVRKI